MSTTPGAPGPDDETHPADPPDPFAPSRPQPEPTSGYHRGPELPRSRRRFSGGAVVGGILPGLVMPMASGLLLGVVLLLVGVGGWFRGWFRGSFGVFLIALALLWPTVLGVVLASRPGSPTNRGLWLGVSIGSAIGLIVGGPTCVSFLRS